MKISSLPLLDYFNYFIIFRNYNHIKKTYENTLDEQLFGALLTALNSFAEEIAHDGLSNFELSDMRFTILKRAHFVFIANSDKKIKPKKVLQELRTVMDIFFTVYSKETIDN